MDKASWISSKNSYYQIQLQFLPSQRFYRAPGLTECYAQDQTVRQRSMHFFWLIIPSTGTDSFVSLTILRLICLCSISLKYFRLFFVKYSCIYLWPGSKASNFCERARAELDPRRSQKNDRDRKGSYRRYHNTLRKSQLSESYDPEGGSRECPVYAVRQLFEQNAA